MESYMPVVWLVATIIFGVAEAVTVQFISIWFAGGALAALIASMLGAPLWIQVTLFFVAAAILLIATRPIAKKLIGAKKTATNADMVIGSTGIVEQPINNLRETGRVFVNGLSWAARSEDGSEIATDETVIVKRIEGAKVFVEAVKS